MTLAEWAEQMHRTRQEAYNMRSLRQTLPDQIRALWNTDQELAEREAAAQEQLERFHLVIEQNQAIIDAVSCVLTGHLAARRVLDYWYRAADPSVLRMRCEARELMIVLGTLIAAKGIVEATGSGPNAIQECNPYAWVYVPRLPGIKQAYKLLADGCPARMVCDYLIRLRDSADAAPPIPLPGDVRKAVSIEELGFFTDGAAAEFLGLAAPGLNFKIPTGGVS